MVIKMRCTGYHVGDVIPLNLQPPMVGYVPMQTSWQQIANESTATAVEARHVYEFIVDDHCRDGYPADGAFVGRQFNSTPLTLAFRDKQPFQVALTYDVTFTPTPVSCGLPD